MLIYKLVLKPLANKNDRVHNLPEVTKIAALFKSEDGEVPNYNVLLCNKTEKLKTLSHFSSLKDSATYLLFFKQKLLNGKRKKLIKILSFNPLHHRGLLFQQFVVDPYTAIKRNRLNYVIRLNKELKQRNNKQIEDLLKDYLIGDKDNKEAPKKVKELNFLAVTLVQEDSCI
uniref:Uncharacterized protein n=1 Tax=Strongyloides venezuelensis TaxID=75913 RepID=A0A0K0FGK6_STRVS